VYAGIDGGQSGSRVVLGDERRVIGLIDGPPLFTASARADAALGAAIDALVARARAELHVPPDDELGFAVAGVSGHDDAVRVAPRMLVVHDADVAHAGALRGGAGIVVAAGTGSVALGTDAAGHRVRRGGWGYVFGDEGSAFWIAGRALAAAMRDEDAGNAAPLAAAARAFFDVASLRALQHAVRRGDVTPERVAGFAPTVLACARDGNVQAAHVCAEAVRLLAELVRDADRRLDHCDARVVSWAGSLFADARIRDAWAAAVAGLIAGANVKPPDCEPALGALLLAYREAGVSPPLGGAA